MASQIGQDDFVIKTLKEKRNGTFVDIGCFHPTDINNTFILERDYNWTGINIDLFTENEFDDSNEAFSNWPILRPDSVVIKADALTIDYSSIFKGHKLPKTIDYLSIDLEPPTVTFDVFKLLPLNEYKFNIITYEHDGYRMGQKFIAETRKYITSFDYVLFETVNDQDDYYVHLTTLRGVLAPEFFLNPPNNGSGSETSVRAGNEYRKFRT